MTYDWICLSSFLSCLRSFDGFIPSVCDCWRVHLRGVNYMVVPWILCCFNEWRFDFFSKCPICKFDNYWWNFIMLRNRGDWFSFGRWALSILDSISSFWGSMVWGITLCISFFATILVVVSQDSLSDSCLMFRKMRVFLRLQLLVSSRLDHLGGSLSDS